MGSFDTNLIFEKYKQVNENLGLGPDTPSTVTIKIGHTTGHPPRRTPGGSAFNAFSDEEGKIPSSNIAKFSSPQAAKRAASKQKYRTQVFMGDDDKFWVPSTNREAGQLKKDGYEVYVYAREEDEEDDRAPCPDCNGSGFSKGSNEYEWETYLEPCEACNGDGYTSEEDECEYSGGNAEVYIQAGDDAEESNCESGHDDDFDGEIDMARAELLKAAEYATKLFDHLANIGSLEGWTASKITKASDYLSSVYHALEYDALDANVEDEEDDIEIDEFDGDEVAKKTGFA